jgi:hypothetical protein
MAAVLETISQRNEKPGLHHKSVGLALNDYVRFPPKAAINKRGLGPRPPAFAGAGFAAGGPYPANCPPSTVNNVPVIFRAASDAR